MKKLVFTALAIMAFSGVSMANTIADEEVVKENKEVKIAIVKKDSFQVLKYQFVVVNCQRVYNSTYEYSRNQGYTDAQANFVAFAAYDKCLGCESVCQ